MIQIFGVGIFGCGNIFVVYMCFVFLFNGIEICVCVDLSDVVVKVWVDEFDLWVEMVDGFLKVNDIDIIVNFIVFNVYFEVFKKIFEVGKYVYFEKFFVLSVEEGKVLVEFVVIKGLCVGFVFDIFLGGVYQFVCYFVDINVVGKIIFGICFV